MGCLKLTYNEINYNSLRVVRSDAEELEKAAQGWLFPDPMGQHFSPYLGMSNNPVSFIDPTGGRDRTHEEEQELSDLKDRNHRMAEIRWAKMAMEYMDTRWEAMNPENRRGFQRMFGSSYLSQEEDKFWTLASLGGFLGRDGAKYSLENGVMTKRVWEETPFIQRRPYLSFGVMGTWKKSSTGGPIDMYVNSFNGSYMQKDLVHARNSLVSATQGGAVIDATLGVVGGVGEIMLGLGGEIFTGGLSTALVVDGVFRAVLNGGKLVAALTSNADMAQAIPGNVGGLTGKIIDGYNGGSVYDVGKAQASLGLINDVAVMITPAGNAGAWSSMVRNPSLFNGVSLIGSYVGSTTGMYNNTKLLLDANGRK